MDRTFFSVLIGPFIIFAIVYLILAILCALRLLVLRRSPNALRIGKLFYINISLTCFFRCITSIISTYFAICFQRDSSPIDLDSFNIMFLDFLYIPDILIWNCFAFLYSQLIVFFYKGHLQKSYEDFQTSIDGFHWDSFKTFIVFVGLVTAIQVIFTTLASTETISLTIFLIENAVFSFMIPLILFITEFKLHYTFSGLPYRSLFASENKGRINKRIIYWGFARTLHGVMDILLVSYHLKHFNFNDLIQVSTGYAGFAAGVFILIGEKILTEIVPYLLVFDMDFLTIFFTYQSGIHTNDLTLNVEQIKDTLLDNEKPILNENRASTNENKQISFSSIEDIQFNPLPRIDINLISVDKLPQGDLMRNRGLGIIKVGNKDRIFRLCFREINIKKVSKYIMEETVRDLSTISALQNELPELLVKTKGFDFNLKENKIFIYYEYLPLGSLKESLEKKKLGMKFLLNFDEKLRFSLEIARIFNKFHSLEPPLIHGHLTSSNILLDKIFKPKISDILLQSFKKYAGIMTNYCNKTQYTAPEYLEERGNVVLNARKPADIYSFGVILWEIFTEKEPFMGISLKKLAYLVVKEKSRPKIPEEIPEEIANIIRVCWQHDEEKRPEFACLVKNMENLGYLNESEELKNEGN